MSRLYASRTGSTAAVQDRPSFGDISRRAAIDGVAGNLKTYLPPNALQRDPAHPVSARDFSSIPPRTTEAPHAMQSAAPVAEREREEGVTNDTPGNIFVSGDRNVKGISGSGSGTVVTTYTPEANDKSTKIVFIQVMRELLDGVPAMPSESDVSFSYQDADTTSDFHHVDYVSGEKDPYYSGDDPQDIGTQGNALTGTAASTNDTPHYPDASFPAGKSSILYEFRTAAFSAAGADAGTYYGYSDWTYTATKGSPEATATTGTGSGGPGSKFTDAVDLFNSNHGFSMPGTGLGAGAIAAIVAGAVVGAAALGLGIAALAGAF